MTGYEEITCEHVSYLASRIAENFAPRTSFEFIAGIPNGGIPVAYAVAQHLPRSTVVIASIATCDPRSTLIVDDIFDSGRTLRPYLDHGFRCAVLVSRRKPPYFVFAAEELHSDDWIIFPWEKNNSAAGPKDAIVRLLEYLGRDPNEAGIKETPRRVLEWFEMFREGQELGSNLTTFDGETYDEMVLVKDIPFVALCEHHLVPFVGKAAVAYIPDKIGYEGWAQINGPADAQGERDIYSPILGLSKLARIVQWKARRTTVQERLAAEIKAEISKAASTPHVAVSLEAEHFCMTLRGAKAHGSKTITNALSGAFKEEQSTRSEFLSLARS